MRRLHTDYPVFPVFVLFLLTLWFDLIMQTGWFEPVGLTNPCRRKFFFFFRLPRRSLSVAVAAWNCKKAWTRVTFQVGWGFVNRLNPGMLPLHCQHPRTPHCGFTFLKYTPKLHRRVYCRTDLFTLHLQCILHLTITCAFRPSTRHPDTDRLLMSGVNVITKQDYPCVV